MNSAQKSDMAALLAVCLWGLLAPLSYLLPNTPPFLKTGIALVLGSICAIPVLLSKKVRPQFEISSIGLGIYGLFGYHAFLFLALSTAPAVQANLINYLWPLLIILLAPIFQVGSSSGPRILGAGLLGFFGAGLATVSGGQGAPTFYPGYLLALMAAFVWATYSLGTKTLKLFSTGSLGIASLIAGLFSLLVHFAFEAPAQINSTDWLVLFALGLGPLGAAFYFWDYALKKGDPQQAGLLAFFTPLLSTVLLLFVSGQTATWELFASAFLIIGAAALGKSMHR